MTCQLFTRCEAAQRSALTTEAFIPKLQSEVPRTNLQRVVGLPGVQDMKGRDALRHSRLVRFETLGHRLSETLCFLVVRAGVGERLAGFACFAGGGTPALTC